MRKYLFSRECETDLILLVNHKDGLNMIDFYKDVLMRNGDKLLIDNHDNISKRFIFKPH